MTELFLCRDVYHCLPSELDKEDAERIMKHIICMDVESMYRDRKKERDE